MREAWAQTLTKWRLLSVQEEPTIEVAEEPEADDMQEREAHAQEETK
jgi:hypothetical protein